MSGEGPRGWAAPLYAAVLDATAVGAGTSVLDLGCGAGLFARAAADRGARVTGVDVDPAAVARAAAEVPEAFFAVGDAHDPPSGPFDVVTAVQVIAHVADPVAVLAAAGRVGGLVVATGWGPRGECDVRVLGEALAAWLPPPTPRVMADDADPLRHAVERAGLVIERVNHVRCVFDHRDEDDVLRPLLASGMGRAAARRAGPAALRAAVLEHLRPYRTAAGGYRLHNVFQMVVARPRAPQVDG